MNLNFEGQRILVTGAGRGKKNLASYTLKVHSANINNQAGLIDNCDAQLYSFSH